MHRKNRRCTLLCECGKTYHPTIKFGNETMCDDCYKRHDDEFFDWLDSLSIEEQRGVLAGLCLTAIELGVKVPATVEEEEQVRIDRIAAELLADVEVKL